MSFRGIERGKDWINLAQVRDQFRVFETFGFLKILGNYRVSLTSLGLSSGAQLHRVSYLVRWSYDRNM
jgi:hypothetical protein